MRALDRKLWRDLARMWGQAITIALVVACGVASWVTMRTAYVSVVTARDRHYASERFADVFAHVERAPDAIASRLEALDGVARVHTRIVRDLLLPMPGMVEPAVGHVIGIPDRGPPPLDALHLVEGRMPEPGREDEVVVLAGFAQAHGLRSGDRIPAVLNGTLRDLRVVGVALSPEFVFAVGAGALFQDERRFGVLWMTHDAIAAAFRMEGSFDDVLVTLQPRASPERVVADVRRVLEPYGPDFVVARDRQPSNRVVAGELSQLRSYAAITPGIFLGVAAFLVNVVLARTLHLHRGQIAMLQAIGYTRREIGIHYTELVAIIAFGGAALGVGAGAYLGRGMVDLYRPYFRFPDLAFRLDAGVVAVGVLISTVTAFAGAFGAVARALRTPPAEAMRPEAPTIYRRPFFERLGVARLLGVSARMVMREMVRRPLRTVLSCVGIAFATAIVVVGFFLGDSFDMLAELVFEKGQRNDVEVSFDRPVSPTVLGEAAQLPGVLDVEGRRTVPVRIAFAQRERDVVLDALPERPFPLRSPATWPPTRVAAPAGGVALGEELATILGVHEGDEVTLELLEGDRRKVDVAVTDLVPDVFGLFVYAAPETVRRIVGEQGSVSSVLFSVERRKEDALVARLATMRNVVAITRRSETYARFLEQTEYVGVTKAVLTAFGAIIAFGVVYNQARIALSMRSRDLASLRVLGFHRSEISAVLLGELAVYVLAGIPLGFVFGRGLVHVVVATVDQEMYRIPGVISARTYAFATIAILAAAVVSALAVRRKLDRLDLVAVLKTRE